MDFPELKYADLYKLQLLLLALEKEPKEKQNLPYDDAIICAIDWFLQQRKSNKETKDVDLNELDLLEETSNLYRSTQALEAEEQAMDARERISVYKMKMTLLDNILELNERAKRIKNIGEFQQFVFSILTPEQKEKVLSIIEG